MTKKIYAIGGIHGQKAMLDQALDLIHADGGRTPKSFFWEIMLIVALTVGL